MNTVGQRLCLFAVAEEAKPFLRTARGMPGLRVEITGIGPRKAREAALLALEKSRPTLVLSCGFAGGLDPSLPRGTVLCSVDDGFPLESALIEAEAIHGRFVCSDRIVVTAAEKAALWQQTGADAVEMESGVIRAICRERGVPSATVRVISDAADEDLPLDFNRLSGPNFELSYARLAAELLRRPGKALELLRFRRVLRQAACCLAPPLVKALSDNSRTQAHPGSG
ncbi:MAG: hypothetical protein KA191_10400 [Verrucomicrobia bacterium]|nr:hypothetical protein [Verrucomicrobiota bacterium]OQC66189.1 MAG: 5'-methylthioadenosine/S-adenosylhomocysteine nucleosidase [Verrucomicrobia bacterium ADurb.Bin006]MDI9379959.1 hypothetical protein [Verrucomicrobiota bacterium]NMD20661.1 hypothetical protein [Verrucomicrobiota bacterium]HOA62842.1 hypothetical protein [Verrucomicrobiota bacterium]